MEVRDIMTQYTHIIYCIIPSILFHHIDDEIAGIFYCPWGNTVFLNCIFAVCGDECIIVLGDLIKGIYIIMICINKVTMKFTGIYFFIIVRRCCIPF